MGIVNTTVELQTMTCSVCGVNYAIERRWGQKRSMRVNGECEGWWCPAGHNQVFRKTDVEGLQEKLDQKERELVRQRAAHDQTRADVRHQRERAEKTERQLSAQKGVTTRIKNRIARGVCPCCNRFFSELQQHIRSQHPDYAPEGA